MCFRFSLFSCLLLCGVLDLLRVAVLSSFLIYIYIYREREREREEEKKEKIIPTFNKLNFFLV